MVAGSKAFGGFRGSYSYSRCRGGIIRRHAIYSTGQTFQVSVAHSIPAMTCNFAAKLLEYNQRLRTQSHSAEFKMSGLSELPILSF